MRTRVLRQVCAKCPAKLIGVRNRECPLCRKKITWTLGTLEKLWRRMQ